ncbi:Sphingolipid long chain base-responsive protein PIL1 [Rhodotorula toruloides]|nr:Sphingolipid long chain base-responsive protein PIL1 [Rhodotorula toruloides]
MSLFQKLAHNPRVSLGPRDIKQLQDYISNERRLVDQTQRLAAERDKASASLREWGSLEGPDLEDVLGRVCSLYEYLSKAELAFAEHNGNYRMRFKDIRTKEENLSSLRKSRDSLAGRIEAQERKVSKMKEENKDLPTQRQRLRDMQQEMIGLEHSVLTEETRLSDFKRRATREALSLKFGAMLELAEKTVIIAELGKLIVDMLPTDQTEPGQTRAYYDGYTRTEELLQEAQRCLQDVVFNPAPVTEGYAQTQHHAREYSNEGAQQQTPAQFEDSGIRPVHGDDFAREHERSSSQQGGQYGTYASSYAQQQQQYPPYDDGQHRAAHTSVDSSHGPQLQPLPDFRPLSVMNPSSQYPSAPTPAVDGYASRSPNLAPPAQDDRYDPNRSSLAYMGEAPQSEYLHDGRQGGTQDDVEAREAEQAFAAEARERAQHEQNIAQSGYGQSPYESGSAPVQHVETAGEGEEDVVRRDMHAGADMGIPSGPLSPITEVPTSAMPQGTTPNPQDVSAPRASSSQGHGQIDYARPPSAAEQRHQYEGGPPERSYSPAPSTALPTYATHAPQVEVSSPTSYGAATAVPTSPLAQPQPSTLSSGTTGAFEPRALTPKTTGSGDAGSRNDRRPIQIRPAGDALGSKHGDVYVPSRFEAAPYSPASPRAPSDAGMSGYFNGPPGANNASGEPKRTLPASAFRRPQPPPGPGSYNSAAASGRLFAASGYQYDPAAQPGPAGPSESELIAQQWRETSIPQGAPGIPAPMDPQAEMGTPTFDTRPLQVNKNRNGSVGVGRSGTLPPGATGGSRLSSYGVPEGAAPPQPDSSIGAPPPITTYNPPSTAPVAPLSPSAQEGFGSNRFVTRLD